VDRREVMRGLAVMFGAELLLPIRAAMAQGLDPVRLTGAALFTDSLREDTVALVETIIPKTETPGAGEAGVAEFVEFMLQEWYPTDDRKRFLDGMTILSEHCGQRFNMAFSSLDQKDQVEVVAALQDGMVDKFEDGGRTFFSHIKQLTIFGYYTSEIGMTVERRYLPVPGDYDGSYPYEKVRTLFTS
jgi:gluconate 2-dehydrogenase gamma chain